MKREIKFRGKDKRTNKWVYGYYIFRELNGEHLMACNSVPGGELRFYEVYPETVGQFTELKDKEYKEIYEGDIIKRTHGDGYCHFVIERFNFRTVARFLPNLPYKLVVGLETWGPDYHYFDLYMLEWYELEIIGNIYNNPEFLIQ